MKNIILLISVLEKTSELLVSVGENNWATSICSFRDRCRNLSTDNFEQLRTEVLRIYAGMGSFSDLVLYKHGQPMIEENQLLDELRKDLFQILNDR